MWNPIHYAIYYQRLDILKLFLNQFSSNMLIGMRLPPINENSEYIIPYSQVPNQSTRKSKDQSAPRKMKPVHNGNDSSPENVVDEMPSTNFAEYQIWQGQNHKQILNLFIIICYKIVTVDQQHIEQVFYYNPSDARVQCFGLELAIRNKDSRTLSYLWNDHSEKWEAKHLAYTIEKLLQEKWDAGLEMILRSKTSQMIFKALNPEDKDNFLHSKIVDKITDRDFWEHSPRGPLKVTKKQITQIVRELSLKPYGGFSVLKFPQLFIQEEQFDRAIKTVQKEDIYDFVEARIENLGHLQQFATQATEVSSETMKMLNDVLRKGETISMQAKRMPPSPDMIIKVIKLGNLQNLKRFFDQEQHDGMLKQLNLYQGYEDSQHIEYLLTFILRRVDYYKSQIYMLRKQELKYLSKYSLQ